MSTSFEHQPGRSTATAPLDAQTFAIGILGLSAVVLLVGLLMALASPTPAYGIGMNASAGEYFMCTQQLTQSQEALIVIDQAAEKVGVYGYDFSRRQLIPITAFDLQRVQKRIGKRSP